MKDSPSVLITGCSSGIGRAAALEMKSRGWRVLATARKEEDLNSLESDGLEPVEVDVGSDASVAACAERALQLLDGAPDGLVNNAGFGHPGALEDVSREDMRRQFEVNVFGLLDLTNRLLPGMIERGSGRIVHVSSVVGRMSLPFMGIYSASKFAVEAIADAQRVELDRTGVVVSLVEPGPIVTRFFNNATSSGDALLGKTESRFSPLYQKELSDRDPAQPKPFALPPEAVARKIAHALTVSSPRKRYKVTLPAHLGAWMSRLAPDALIDFLLKMELRKRFSESL